MLAFALETRSARQLAFGQIKAEGKDVNVLHYFQGERSERRREMGGGEKVGESLKEREGEASDVTERGEWRQSVWVGGGRVVFTVVYRGANKSERAKTAQSPLTVPCPCRPWTCEEG